MYADDVRDDNGELYSDRPSVGPCEGHPRCTAIGAREFDPYDNEINEERIWRYLCAECYQERADDI